jgi:hypothetical protein
MATVTPPAPIGTMPHSYNNSCGGGNGNGNGNLTSLFAKNDLIDIDWTVLENAQRFLLRDDSVWINKLNKEFWWNVNKLTDMVLIESFKMSAGGAASISPNSNASSSSSPNAFAMHNGHGHLNGGGAGGSGGYHGKGAMTAYNAKMPRKICGGNMNANGSGMFGPQSAQMHLAPGQQQAFNTHNQAPFQSQAYQQHQQQPQQHFHSQQYQSHMNANGNNMNGGNSNKFGPYNNNNNNNNGNGNGNSNRFNHYNNSNNNGISNNNHQHQMQQGFNTNNHNNNNNNNNGNNNSRIFGRIITNSYGFPQQAL